MKSSGKEAEREKIVKKIKSFALVKKINIGVLFVGNDAGEITISKKDLDEILDWFNSFSASPRGRVK